jgi:hypothetical protein
MSAQMRRHSDDPIDSSCQSAKAFAVDSPSRFRDREPDSFGATDYYDLLFGHHEIGAFG